jgi:hypothetical protein
MAGGGQLMDAGATPSASDLVRRILFYKYVLAVVLILVVSAVLWVDFRNEVATKDVLIGLIAPAVTALLLSIFYDLFTKREEAIRNDEDRKVTLREFSEKLWEQVDLDLIPRDQKERIVRRFIANPEIMKLFGGILVGPRDGEFLIGHLANLSKGRALRDVEVVNKLVADDHEDTYALEFTQHFSVSREGKETFLILFSSDNELFNSLAARPLGVDAMVGVSEVDWKHLDQRIHSMKVKASRAVEGHRDSQDLQVIELRGEELTRHLGGLAVGRQRVRGFSAALPKESENYHFTFSYSVRNSLADPYYSWFAENPMFVRSVTIDYSGIQHRVGRVSANCFIGSYTSEPEHDLVRGVYRVQVDGLVWPGQGALVIWRPPEPHGRHGAGARKKRD